MLSARAGSGWGVEPCTCWIQTVSTALESHEQKYAAEVLKVNAGDSLLKRPERGIRGLKGVQSPQVSA